MQNSEFKTVKGQLFKNSSLIFIGRIVSILSSFLIIPLIVSQLEGGMDTFGVWAMILALTQMLLVGNQAATSTILWQSAGVSNLNSAPETLRNIRTAGTLSMILATLAALLCQFYGGSVLSLMRVAETNENVSALQIVAWGGLLAIMADINASMLDGQHFSGRVSNIRTAGGIAGNLTTCLFLLCGIGFCSMAYGLILNYLILFVAYNCLRAKLLNVRFMWPVLLKWREVKEIGGFALCVLAGRIVALSRTQMITIIIGVVVSKEWTGYYNSAAKLNSLLMEVSNFFTIPMVAGVGKLKNSGNEAKRLFKDAQALIAVLVGSLITVLTCASGEIIFVWLGGSFPQISYMLYILLFEYGLAILLTALGVAYGQGCGKVHYETIYLALNFVLNLLLLMIFYRHGIWGIMGATASSWIISSFFFAVILRRKLEISGVITGAMKVVIASIAAIIVVKISFAWSRDIGGGRILYVVYGMAKGGIGWVCFIALLLGPLRLIEHDRLRYGVGTLRKQLLDFYKRMRCKKC